MKILITGVCGFVGSTLARALRESSGDCEILGIDNLVRPGSETNRRVLKDLGVNVSHADLRLASDFENLPPVDWVIDAAANPSVLAGADGRTSSRQLLEHNLTGTVNMLEFCKHHGAGFILLSTSRVYSINALGEIPLVVRDEAFSIGCDISRLSGVSESGVSEHFSTESPISLYGATKLASEALALEYGMAFEFPVWVNRCGVLGGAGQFGHAEQGIFSFWLHSWFERKPLRYIGFGGAGHQVRDCLHPRDLLPVLLKQMRDGSQEGERLFNLSGGPDNAISLARLSAWCEERFGPHEVAADTEKRQYDIPWLVLDSSRAKERWDWSVATSLDTIFREIADFAEANPNWLEMSSPG